MHGPVRLKKSISANNVIPGKYYYIATRSGYTRIVHRRN
jgi:hypothetical protein